MALTYREVALTPAWQRAPNGEPITRAENLLLSTIVSYQELPANREWSLGVATLAVATMRSELHTRAVLAELERKRLLRIVRRRGQPERYFVLIARPKLRLVVNRKEKPRFPVNLDFWQVTP